jgi:hypothetical protein
MREIKFRAWDKENKKMLEVDGINFNEFGFQQFKAPAIVCNLPDTELRQIIKLSEIELMQYTEIKDKNGREIYEGDVVTFNHPNKSNWIVKDIISLASLIITWEKATHKTKTEIEVIGNIHQNPELLKAEVNKNV